MFNKPPALRAYSLVFNLSCFLWGHWLKIVVTEDILCQRARVSTRAILVTSLAECKRGYGSNAKSKVVFGVVEEVVCGQTATGQANYTTKARCTLGGTATKVASVNSRSVSLAPVEVVQPAVPQQGVEVEAVVAAPQPPPPNQPEEYNNHTRSVPDEQQAPEPMPVGQESVILTPLEQQQQGPQPVATQHGFEWFDELYGVSIGNLIRQREWVLKTPVNDEISVMDVTLVFRYRRTENRCEIQDSACGDNGVMLCLKLTKRNEEEEDKTTEGNGLPHGFQLRRKCSVLGCTSLV
ncbi:unnamed protein product [Cylindrotheca closterium]|uniref:Uncharacterized protein n=1 Tax=Cylindrotheca closterium TaxID=2856 RepID=A0AAD2G2M7_9STRA|nr:unnamed protein product [Cylindrotheca closterium]